MGTDGRPIESGLPFLLAGHCTLDANQVNATRQTDCRAGKPDLRWKHRPQFLGARRQFLQQHIRVCSLA